MEWVADVSVGDWLRERLDTDWSMHHFVPHGFTAYARVFHRPGIEGADAENVPTSWAEAAAAFGTTLHAQASWQHLVRTPTDGDWHERPAPDGRVFTAPAEGELEPELLAHLAQMLVAHTATPDDGYAAVWEGWGGLLGGYRHRSSSASFGWLSDQQHREVMYQSLRDRFNNPFRRAKWEPGVLSDEISKGSRLELPDRAHVLFRGALRAFAAADEAAELPWQDAPLSILWPADHAWVMASEIDFDSTIVGGSVELIQAICADQRLEALQIREGSSLHWDADEVNR